MVYSLRVHFADGTEMSTAEEYAESGYHFTHKASDSEVGSEFNFLKY